MSTNPLLSGNGLTLDWLHISHQINLKSTGKDLQILTDVWGKAEGSKLTAILGPSGAGKTTLLNILSQRLTPSDSNSKIKVNGHRVKGLSKLTAFVEQEDALWPTSTTKEALYFSARLRLSTVTNDECKVLVNDMIKKMGLERCADTIIGNPQEERGLSGGERKRVSIGIELISNPPCLFLDEPTSGLDSARAYDVIRVLKNLAKDDHCTILATIHQPSSEIFFDFDNVIVMNNGRTVYCGTTEKLSDFFEIACQVDFPEHYNPADYALANVGKVPVENYQKSSQNEENDNEEEFVSIKTKKEGTTSQISTLQRILMITKREIQTVWRNKATLKVRLGLVIGLNVILGLVTIHTGKQSDQILDVQTHFAVLTLISTGTMISISNPIALSFPIERPVLSRELSGRFYSIPSLFFSKFIVECIVGVIQAVLAVAIIHLLVELEGNFLLLVLIVWGLGLVASSVALLISCSVDSVKTAVSFNPILIVPQLVFAGFIVPVSKIPTYLKIFVYLSQLRYAIALLVLVEFDKDPYARYIFDENDIHKDQTWIYCLILFLNFFIFRILAIFVLWKRTK